MREDLHEILTVLLILTSSFILGIVTEPIVSSTNSITGNVIEETFTSSKKPHEEKYGTGWFIVKSDGPLYTINKPNTSGWADSWGTPPFKVQINNRGLRDSSFNLEKSENTFRILVIGDSLTFGYGINRSDVYIERLERELNEEFSKKIQVINAGVPGYGMKDKYLLLKHKGLQYNPDLIVVTVNSNDGRSREKLNKMQKQAREKVRTESQNHSWTENEIRERIRKESYRIESQYIQNQPIENTSFRYLEVIRKTSHNHNTPLIYYRVDKLPDKARRYLDQWSEETNSSVYNVPKKFQSRRNKFRISRWDGHPNAMGHQLLAEGIMNPLETQIRDGSSEY